MHNFHLHLITLQAFTILIYTQAHFLFHIRAENLGTWQNAAYVHVGHSCGELGHSVAAVSILGCDYIVSVGLNSFRLKKN